MGGAVDRKTARTESSFSSQNGRAIEETRSMRPAAKRECVGGKNAQFRTGKGRTGCRGLEKHDVITRSKEGKHKAAVGRRRGKGTKRVLNTRKKERLRRRVEDFLSKPRLQRELGEGENQEKKRDRRDADARATGGTPREGRYINRGRNAIAGKP